MSMTRVREQRIRASRPLTILVLLALALVLVLTVAACGGDDGAAGDGSGTPAAGGTGGTITGAGASFPFPLYSTWASDYEKVSGVKLNYQSIGSSGGIEQIMAKTVDFGASDAPLTTEELEQAGLTQFPMTMGGVSITYNLEGVADGELMLDGPTLTDIFMGKITKWNDPALKALNPDLTLPDMDITVVHRADGSGTTFIFTSYLSAVSPEWESEYGAEKEVSWPAGVGGKGNEGVSAQIQNVKGAVGYVEYAYALETGLASAQLKNKDGNYVKADITTFAAAAANADWENTPGMAVILVDQPGPDSWPIAGASFIIVYKEQEDAAQAKLMLDFFDWALKNGQPQAEELHYVPLPDNVVALVEDLWTQDIASGGKAVWE
jgi:phosphate transport system substrate-binding protein